MAENVDFNSSDLEFEPPTTSKQAAFRGQASIDLIIKNAHADRISSKKTIQQLEFGHGAPSTRAHQTLWINRFNAYRQHSLKQSLSTPFTGDDMLRFFDATIDKIKPNVSGKPAPNDHIVTHAFRVLHEYGDFLWDEKDGFKISRRDGKRLMTWIADAVQAGRLTKGNWSKKTWIGFATLSRMIRAFLEYFHAHGCWSWDVVVAKCFSVVLVASLCARSGDVARSNGYKGAEYMQWRHIDLYCEGEVKYENLRAIVILEFEKESKDTRNKESRRYLRPLTDVDDCHHVCPIALMMTHVLRNGLVFGRTVNEVLDQAAATPGLRVRWKHPIYPVLTSFARKPSRCDLTKPTNESQLLASIKQMGLVTNMLCRVYMHATRLGAARDLAHLPNSNEGHGVSTDAVRQSMGHKPSTAARGTTERYVGGVSREFYNDRAANQFKSHRREPNFGAESANDVVKAPVTNEEIETWKRNNKENDVVGFSKKNEIKRLRRNVRRERLNKYMQTAAIEGGPVGKSSENTLHVLQPVPSRQHQTLTESRALIPRSVEVSHESTSSSEFDYTSVDPTLLDDTSLEQAQVNQEALISLQAAIFPDYPTSGVVTREQGTRDSDKASIAATVSSKEQLLFEESGKLILGLGIQEKPLLPQEWVTTYARINVVRNENFAIQWSAFSEKGQPFEDTIGPHSLKGNSRDDPKPWIFTCHKTVGCTYESFQGKLLDSHQITCNEALVQASKRAAANHERLLCTWNGCDKTFADAKSLKSHVVGYHEWQPRPCEHGCNPSKQYTTRVAYSSHQTDQHSGRWPAPCSYPNCKSDKLHNSARQLKYHLRHEHGVTGAANQVQYLPPLPPKVRWAKQSCFLEECKNDTVYHMRSTMLRHLTSYHQMTEADANNAIDNNVPFETVTRTIRVLGPSDRRVLKRTIGAMGGDEKEEEDTTSASRKTRKKSH